MRFKGFAGASFASAVSCPQVQRGVYLPGFQDLPVFAVARY